MADTKDEKAPGRQVIDAIDLLRVRRPGIAAGSSRQPASLEVPDLVELIRKREWDKVDAEHFKSVWQRLVADHDAGRREIRPDDEPMAEFHDTMKAASDWMLELYEAAVSLPVSASKKKFGASRKPPSTKEKTERERREYQCRIAWALLDCAAAVYRPEEGLKPRSKPTLGDKAFEEIGYENESGRPATSVDVLAQLLWRWGAAGRSLSTLEEDDRGWPTKVRLDVDKGDPSGTRRKDARESAVVISKAYYKKLVRELVPRYAVQENPTCPIELRRHFGLTTRTSRAPRTLSR